MKSLAWWGRQSETPKTSNENLPGYHLAPIHKGIFGEASKIAEETDEFIEAIEQGAELMALLELSDLYGAMRGYLERYHPSISMDDLAKMSGITKRAFENGHR